MRNIIIMVILLSFKTNISGQIRDFSEIPMEILEHFDKMGIDDSLTLNCYEAAYFNVVFDKARRDFDFKDKKVGLIDKVWDSKSDYFRSEKQRFNRGEDLNVTALYLFNASQKEESGGYDAAILCWSKKVIPDEKIVQMLKKRTEENTKKKSKKPNK